MNEKVVSKTSEYFKTKGIILPKISELINPHSINKDKIEKFYQGSLEKIKKSLINNKA